MMTEWSSDRPTRCDLNAPSPWAPGLTNRQAIRLDDLQMQVSIGALALSVDEAAELAQLQAKAER